MIRLDTIPPIYEQETAAEKIVYAIFVAGSWTWYVFEAEKQDDGDFLFFGLVDGFEKELGYSLLSELEQFATRRPLDQPTPLSQVCR